MDITYEIRFGNSISDQLVQSRALVSLLSSSTTMTFSVSPLHDSLSSSPPQVYEFADKEMRTQNTPERFTDTVGGTGPSSGTSQGKEGIEEVLTRPFPDFSHENVLAKPYDEELRRDLDFNDRE